MTTICKVIIGILLAAVIALTVTCLVIYIERSHLQTQVAEDATLITSLKNANENFTTITQQVNASIKKMQDDEAVRAAASAKAVASANASAKSIMAAATKIGEAKPVGDDCAATKLLLDKFFPATK